MTAIQVSNKGLADIMRLRCVSKCHKATNLRYAFELRSGEYAYEGDWIINADSDFDYFVISNERFKMVKQAMGNEVGEDYVAMRINWKIPKRKDDQSLDDWIKSMVGDNKKLFELLHEVSVESYITGTRISSKDGYESK